MTDEFDSIVDLRDGLSTNERAVLYCLNQIQREVGQRNVPTVMLYGRVAELVDISQGELQSILNRMVRRSQ